MFTTDGLSPMQSGRLKTALDKEYRYDGVVRTLRSHIEALAAAGPLELTEGDGMIDYSRTHFNRLASYREQDALHRASQGEAIFLRQRMGGAEAGLRRDQALISLGL
jgi:hypothetical protein